MLEIDVELVDLAVRGDLAAVAVERDARVAEPHVAVDPLGDGARDDGHAELARPALHGDQARAVERLRGLAQLVGRAERLPALGQQRDVGAGRRGAPHEPLGRGQVVVGRGPGAQLDARDARVHGCTLELCPGDGDCSRRCCARSLASSRWRPSAPPPPERPRASCTSRARRGTSTASAGPRRCSSSASRRRRRGRACRARPANCDLDWIPAELSLGSRRVIIGSCRGDVGPMCFNDCTTLRYGKSVNIGPIRCRSAANGVTCRYVTREARRLPHRPRGLRHLAHVTHGGDLRERVTRARARARARRSPSARPRYDREPAFPFENYAELRDAGHARALHPRALRRHGRELQGLHVHLGRARALLPDDGADVQHAQPDGALDGHPRRRPRHAGRRARAPRGAPRRALPLDPRGRRDHEPAALGGHRARRDGRRRDDGRRPSRAASQINGRKVFASLAGAAHAYNFTCRVPGEEGLRFLSVRSDNPGVEIVGDWDTLGMRGTDSRTLVFKDAFVAADDELLPTGALRPARGALAARLPDAHADLHRAHARGRRLRAGLPRQQRRRPAFPRGATCRRSSGPGREIQIA